MKTLITLATLLCGTALPALAKLPEIGRAHV